MKEETKKTFDSYDVLRMEAMQEFDKKVAFEWKVSFSLWAALASVFISFTQANIHAILCSMKIEIISLFSIILFLHAIFLCWIQYNLSFQRKIQHYWGKKMVALLGEDMDYYKNYINKSYGKRGLIPFLGSRILSPMMQLSISIILSMLIIFALSKSSICT